MFNRVISLIGSDNFDKIKKSTILVVGLGGVGGYATEALVRSGIHNIIIVDYDKVDITNNNRQIIANSENVGKLKTDEFKKRISMINPSCNVVPLNIFLDKDNISILDNYKIDYVIDACDTVKTKKLLIDYCFDKNIKIISSMGTAKKLDPSRLKVMDIRKTSYDPLAKIIRKYINDKKTNKKLMVVSTDEKAIDNKELASMIFVPATAGILLANYVIRDIIQK